MHFKRERELLMVSAAPSSNKRNHTGAGGARKPESQRARERESERTREREFSMFKVLVNNTIFIGEKKEKKISVLTELFPHWLKLIEITWSGD